VCPDTYPRWFSLDPLDNDLVQMRQQDLDNISYVVIAPAKRSTTVDGRSRMTRADRAIIITTRSRCAPHRHNR
jgi:hypothetical protein